MVMSDSLNMLVCGRHGRVLFNRNDKWVGEALQLYAEYSEHEVEIIGQMLKPGDVVVEVGANVGAITLPMARMVGPTGQVIAFEPQRPLFQCLAGTIALNSLLNVDCREAACGPVDGVSWLPRIDYTAPDNNLGAAHLISPDAGDGVQVNVVAIDSLRLPRLDFLKLDCEGYEKSVLDGATETIERCRPILFVEDDREGARAELYAKIGALGYTAHRVEPRLFNPYNYAGNPENNYITPAGEHVVSAMLVCLPNGLSCLEP